VRAKTLLTPHGIAAVSLCAGEIECIGRAQVEAVAQLRGSAASSNSDTLAAAPPVPGRLCGYRRLHDCEETAFDLIWIKAGDEAQGRL
jgi:hypothetical protein